MVMVRIRVRVNNRLHWALENRSEAEATAIANDYRVRFAHPVSIAECKRSNTNCIDYRNVVYMMYNYV